MYSRRTFLGTFAAGFFGLGAYAFGFEPLYRLSVTRYDLKLPRWPAGARPLKIAAVADIHAIDPWMNLGRIEEIVAATNAEAPDLIVLLGDFIGTSRLRRRIIEPAEFAPVLAGLKAPLGTRAILGNHDYWWRGGAEPVQRALEAVGIPVFVNQAEKIARDGHEFWLSGTTSTLTGPTYSMPRGPGIFGGRDNLKATLAQITDDAPIIHLAHEPDMFPHVPDRVALTLSGHTHGGQVAIPFVGRPIVPSIYGQRYAYGHIVENQRHLVVSGGLGCSKLPLRFGVPPEIVVMTIGSASV